jgi:tight adherence protein B
MRVIVGGFIALSVYLAWGPLPVIRHPRAVKQFRVKMTQLVKSLRKTPRLSPMAFLWTLHSELMAGLLVDDALGRACATLPSHCMTNTFEALSANGDIATALEADAQRADLEVLADVALIYQVCARTGAPMTDSLMRLIKSVRDQQRRQRTLVQETASTKATAVVLAALPILGILMGLGLGRNPLTWFLHSALGALCLATGVGLEVLGWLWVRLLMRRASTPA